MSDLPKPGDVWGVPDNPETWRLIRPCEDEAFVAWNSFIECDRRYCFRNSFPKELVCIFPKDTP